MIGYIGYITRSLSRNRLRFQLVTIGYTVTTNGYKLHNWLQNLAHWLQVLNGLDLIGYIPPDPAAADHCPPLCFLLSATPERPRRSGQPLVNLQQLRPRADLFFIGVGKTSRVPHIPSG